MHQWSRVSSTHCTNDCVVQALETGPRVWAPIHACNFQVGAVTTINIETRVLSVLSQINMSRGESKVLQVLTMLQYLAEVGPKSPPPGHVAHSVHLIMRPLEQLGISFQPHTVLGYCTSTRSDISTKTCVMHGHFFSAL